MIRVSRNGVKYSYSTQSKVPKEYWDQSAMVVLQGYYNPSRTTEINDKLDFLAKTFVQFCKEVEAKRQLPTGLKVYMDNHLKEYLTGKSYQSLVADKGVAVMRNQLRDISQSVISLHLEKLLELFNSCTPIKFTPIVRVLFNANDVFLSSPVMYQDLAAMDNPGIYFLILRGVVVYVGMSTTSIYGRISGSFGKGGHMSDKLFDEVRAIQYPNAKKGFGTKRDLIEIELFYIQIFLPFYNTLGKDNDEYFHEIQSQGYIKKHAAAANVLISAEQMTSALIFSKL